MSWATQFDEPIPLPDGRKLYTLRDAGDYIIKLPKVEQEAEEWQGAAQALMLVAENDGRLAMFARVGMTKALSRRDVRVFHPAKKDRHWVKRKTT